MAKNDWEISLKYKDVPFCKNKAASIEDLEDIFNIAKRKAR